MEDKRPFIMKFKTDASRYIYDVNTNNILQTDQTVFEIIDDYGSLSNEEIVSKYADRWNRDQVSAALEGIENARKGGFLSSSRPRAMEYSKSLEVIQNSLDSELSQLILEVTQQCNLRCGYCVYSGHFTYQREHNSARMSESTAERAIEFFMSRNANSPRNEATITFYGGEPLLEFQLVKHCVEYAKQRWPERPLRFAITTNGSLLNKAMLSFFEEHGFGLRISIDGPKEKHDMYRVMRNGNGSFDSVMKNIKMIQTEHPTYYSNLVNLLAIGAPPFKFTEVNDFFTESLLEDSRTVNYNIVNVLDSDLGEKLNLEIASRESAGEVNMLMEKYSNILIEGRENDKEAWLARNLFHDGFSLIHNRFMLPLPEKISPNGICLPGKRKLFVAPDGSFYVCERGGATLNIGSIEAGLETEKIVHLIEDYCTISEGECLNCWAVRLCDACYMWAQRGPSLEAERKKKQCEQQRTRMRWLLGHYCAIRERAPNAFDHFALQKKEEN